jgi:hypothetical protein
VHVDSSTAGRAEWWTVTGTDNGDAAEGCVDVELCHGTALPYVREAVLDEWKRNLPWFLSSALESR